MKAGGQNAWKGCREDIRRLANLACRLAKDLHQVRIDRDSLKQRFERIVGKLETVGAPLIGFGEYRDAKGERAYALESFKAKETLKKEMELAWRGDGWEVGRFVSLAFRFLHEWIQEALQAAYDHGYRDGTDVLRAIQEGRLDPFRGERQK